MADRRLFVSKEMVSFALGNSFSFHAEQQQYHYEMGNMLVARGDIDEAKKHYAQALSHLMVTNEINALRLELLTS